MNQTQPRPKSMFLAVELDLDVKQMLAQTLYLDMPKSKIRRQAHRDFHITLGFIKSVKWEDRANVMHAFKPLEQNPILSLSVTEVVALGNYGQILCARFGPQATLEELSNQANKLLTEHTEYGFDQSYASYIPHTKIQTVKHYLPEDLKSQIVEMFRELPYKKIKFKAKNLALMERVKSQYTVIKEYQLRG